MRQFLWLMVSFVMFLRSRKKKLVTPFSHIQRLNNAEEEMNYMFGTVGVVKQDTRLNCRLENLLNCKNMKTYTDY